MAESAETRGSSSTILKDEEYDSGDDALFLEEDEVVGIEKPKKQLLGWIQSKDSGLEVISVVGTGGLGKTTLAKKVYDDEWVKSYFDRHVWMVVSDYNDDDVKHFLENLIKKLTEEIEEESPPQGLKDMSIDNMRSFIKEFLKKKKYIIVLDDVWKPSTWEAIKFALPREGGHGCIIITTRSNSIGDAACSETNHVYDLKPVFSLSYNDLPYYLKYCFLYLSVFPEDDLLDKEEIIRLWIAEGFVRSEQGKVLEEVAEEYLNELCSRNLIQVAEKYPDGSAKAFRVGDLLQESITAKSREHNMITICNGRETQRPNKIRRLAVQKSTKFFPEMNKLEHLRSLLLLYNDGNIELEFIKELLNKCRLLKVLHLAAAAPLETIPDEVFKLYHLKYLCLRGTEVTLIPKEIQYLENLETLDLEWCYVTELPDEILKLNKLRHLLVHNIKNAYDVMFHHTLSVKAPRGIGSSLPSLQSLCCVDADEDGGVKMVREIGKLTQLRRLDIAKLRSEDGKELCSSIAKLTHLHSLKIISVQEGEKMELDYFLSSTGLPFLSTLELCGCIEKVPQWIPSLHGLTTLTLVWSRLREDPLSSLQHLPNLATLWIHDAYVEVLSFKAGGFQKLKELSISEFKCLKWVVVEEGSMPIIQDWDIWDCKLLTDLPKGIEHLARLQEIKFGNMPSEFLERFVEDKINEGVNWRLAHVHDVYFGTVGDGFWSFYLHFHK